MLIGVTKNQMVMYKKYVRFSSLLIIACAVLFFTMFDGFVRFGAVAPAIWITAYGCVLVGFLAAPDRMISVFIRHWPIFVLPVFAILSSVWTTAPIRTPIAGFQLFMTTLIAVMVAQNLNTRQLMLALFIGQTAGLALSLLNIANPIIPASSPINGSLIGIYGHKTAFGYSAVMSCFALMAWLSYSGKEAWGLLYAIPLTPLIINTQSVTANGSFAIVIVLFFMLWLRRINAILARRLLLLFGMLIGIFTSVFALTPSGITSSALNFFGKSTTLTGRIELWQIATETWHDAPLVGVGFSAFWHSAEQAISVNYIHTYVDSRLDGFHNAFLECLVALGGVGVAMLIGMVLIPLMRLGALVFIHLSHDAMIWLSVLICYVLVAMMIQDVGFKQHSSSYMMMVFCYIYAMPLNRRT
jgi:exopolysaccharide production protein ExoQ